MTDNLVVAGPVSGHLDIQPRCAACGDRVLEDEQAVALFGNADSSAYFGTTRPFLFPKVYTKASGFRICRKSGCESSPPSPQTVTVHRNCLAIFTRACSLDHGRAMDHLWAVGAWKNPWPRAHALRLAHDYDMSHDALSALCAVYQIPQLARLPVELIDCVRRHSRHELFWQAVSALTLARRLSATPSGSLRTMALADIARWERSGVLELWHPPSKVAEEEDTARPVIRLTIDAVGIKKIERLPDRPPYQRDKAESQAFVVEEVSALRDVNVCVKHGLVQLRPLPDFPGLRIWDTPAPPSLSQCAIFADKKRPWRHFRTAELNSLVGITFFYWYGLLIGVHPHRTKDSTAVSTYERLASRHRQNTKWMYLPISDEDKIEILGARPTQLGLNVLVRKRLSGDTILGASAAAIAADHWQRREPTTFIYGEPADSSSVPFLGTYCRQLSSPSQDRRARYVPRERGFSTLIPRAPRRGMENMLYYSAAPLAGVTQAVHFYRDTPTTLGLAGPTYKATQGIMLRYANGGSRTLGTVRIGVDPSETVVGPSNLSLGDQFRSRATVLFATPDDFEPLEDGPHHFDTWMTMAGELRFWCSDEESVLSVDMPEFSAVGRIRRSLES